MTTESRLTIAPVGNLQRFASADEHLVDLVAARPIAAHLRAYRADVGLFLAFVATPLTAVALGDVQAFANSLAGLAPSSRTRTLAAVESLLAFGQRTGYLLLNVGAAVKLTGRRRSRSSSSASAIWPRR